MRLEVSVEQTDTDLVDLRLTLAANEELMKLLLLNASAQRLK